MVTDCGRRVDLIPRHVEPSVGTLFTTRTAMMLHVTSPPGLLSTVVARGSSVAGE